MARRKPKFEVYAFEVWVIGNEEHKSIYNNTSPGKARYQYLLDIGDVYPDVSFKDIKVRKLGDCMEMDDVRRIAKARAMPFLHTGMSVTCDGLKGKIIGKSAGNYLKVAFEDGTQGECHPRWKMKYFDKEGKLVREYD